MELNIRNIFDFITAVVPRVKSSRATAVKLCKRCRGSVARVDFKRRVIAVTKSIYLFIHSSDLVR